MTAALDRALALIRSAVKAPGGRLLVAVDGRCASGKTTLAAALSAELGCTVLHMDDFFLPPALRTPERLAAPGGNVDYERFAREVLAPLTEGRPFSYRRFDCKTQALCLPVSVTPSPVTVVEGSYACHPALRDAYGLRLFLTVDPITQLDRIRARNGEAAATVFRDRWIPLEEAYFAACGVENICTPLN